MSVPNQKNIEVCKEEKTAPGEFLAIRRQKAEQLAAKNLGPSAFKVWLYVTSNKDGYVFDLSSQHVADTYGVSTRSFSRAITELEEAGYLVPKVDGGKRFYKFFDMPQPKVITIEVCKSNKE